MRYLFLLLLCVTLSGCGLSNDDDEKRHCCDCLATFQCYDGTADECFEVLDSTGSISLDSDCLEIHCETRCEQLRKRD